MKKLTEYHKTWLKENYGKVSRENCALRLKCSNRTIDRWVSELGLQVRAPKDPSKPSKKPSKVVKVKAWIVSITFLAVIAERTESLPGH
mgnify:CR=1 FL=1